MEKSIKNIRQEFKKNGVFYTPPELAEALLKYLDFEPGSVYDPTCGQGNLLAAFGDGVEKFGQEIFRDELEKAEGRLANFHGYCGDTLKDDGFRGMKFECIVANYPFSIAWEQDGGDERFSVAPALAPKSKADWAFMLHMLHHLDDSGVCVSLCSPGILFRGNAEYKIRRWFVENNYIDKVVAVPGKTFVDTPIATAIVVMRKNREATDITFADLESGSERTVPVEEVKEKDCLLSPRAYIRRAEEKEGQSKETASVEEISSQLEDMEIKNLMLGFERTKNLSACFEDGMSRHDRFVRRVLDAVSAYAAENGI